VNRASGESGGAGRLLATVVFWLVWLTAFASVAFASLTVIVFVYLGATMDSVSSGSSGVLIGINVLVFAAVMTLSGWLGVSVASRFALVASPWWNASVVASMLWMIAAVPFLDGIGPGAVVPVAGPLVNVSATGLVLVVSLLAGQALAHRRLKSAGGTDQ
jgi:hypothetical protein